MTDGDENTFKVQDRRYFDEEGNPRKPSDSELRDGHSNELPKDQPRATAAPPPLDFASLLFTFVHTALVHLGEIEDPTEKTPQDIEGARQMIDILELLQLKTKGNLTAPEERYLETALFDLRMRYLQKSKIIR